LKIYLVRHARSVPRSEWEGPDALRALNPRGRDDALALAAALGDCDEPPTRILSGTPLRCQETMAPFAAENEIPVQVDERLDRGEPMQRLLEIMPSIDEGPLVLCTHADVIGSLLDFFELRDADPGGNCCRKGAFWVLEGSGATPTRAHYVEPSHRRRKPDAERISRTVRAAALDLGSTSFNLLIADVGSDGTITPVIREKVMLRLGAVIANGGRIPREVASIALETARLLHDIADQEKVEHLIPVATASLRDARNGRKVGSAIGEALGMPIRILTGEEEARAIFRAFVRRLELGNDRVLGLDLGGGSLELAVGRGDSIENEVSLPLGAVRLHSELVHDDPMRRSHVKAIRARVRSELEPLSDRLAELIPVSQAVATGGTVRALARVQRERNAKRGASSDPATRITRDNLGELEKLLTASSHEERLRMRGMKKARADVVPTGSVILETVADELGLDGFTICDWGLREGLLLQAQSRDWKL
jgi:exopolyphosphatase/guanosine-5'-triphosphate,3'-diphosphate pyrophosphatase